MPAISGQSPLLSLNSMAEVCCHGLIPAWLPVAGMARSYRRLDAAAFHWVVRDQSNCMQFN
jgi:hypothetical protein